MNIRGNDLHRAARNETTASARLQWLVRKLARRDGAAMALPLTLALLGTSVARERDMEAGEAGTGPLHGTGADVLGGAKAGDKLALLLGDSVFAEHLLTDAELAAGQVRLALRMIEDMRLPGMQVIESAQAGEAAIDGLTAAAAAVAADAHGVSGAGAEVTAQGAESATMAQAGEGADTVDVIQSASGGEEEEDDDRGLLWLVFGIGAAGAGLALAGGKGSDDPVDPPTPPPPPPPALISGQVVKGYVQGAAVYLDTNNDGLPDGDPVYTDAQGRFTFQSSASGASIIVYGGVDTLTNVPLEGMILRAPAGSTVVTPLTTLMDEMMRSDTSMSAAQAQSKILTALGLNLPAGTDLRTYDSVAGIASGGAVVEDAAEVVLNTLSAIQSLISGAGAAEGLAAANAAIGALAQVILQSNGAVNLGTAAGVTTVLQAAFAGTGIGASNADDLVSLATAIASVNGALASASGLGDGALQVTRYALSGFQDLLTGIGANAHASNEYDRDISFGENDLLATAVAGLAGGNVADGVSGNMGASISFAERLEGGRFVFALNPELKFHQGTADKIDVVTARFDVEGVVLQRETRGANGQIITETLAPDGSGVYTLLYSELDKIFIQAPTQFNGVLGAEVTVHYVGLNTTDAPGTIGIQIMAVNDAPQSADAAVELTEDTHHVFSVADFPFSDEVDAPFAGGENTLRDIRIVSLPESGTLYLGEDEIRIEDIQQQLFISIDDINNGRFRYFPGEDGNGDGYASFQFQVRDDGGTARGGVDTSTETYTLTLNVTPASDAPVATGGSESVGEGGEHVFGVESFQFADADGDALAKVFITSLPENGVLFLGDLQLEESDLEGGIEVTAEQLAQGLLRFVPNDGYTGSVSFGYRVQDDSEDAETSGEATMQVEVLNVSDAPQIESNYAQLDEDSAHVFSTGDFEFSDVDGDTLAAVIITGLPTGGILYFGDQALAEGDLADSGFEVSAEDLASGKLSFVPAEDFNGEDSFSYKLRDSGTSELGGVNTSSVASFGLFVAPTPDAPVATSGSASALEDTPYQFSAENFGFTDADGDGLAKVFITSLPGSGTLWYDGDPMTGQQVIGGGFAINAADLSKLSFHPAENGTGEVTFGYKVQDDSSADGAELSGAATLTITVEAVSDAPVASGNSATLNEDGSHQFSSEDFGFSDSDGDSLSAVIITSLPEEGVLRYDGEVLTIDDIESGFEVGAINLGLLEYIPGEDSNGPVDFSYQIRDTGNLENGGENTSEEATFTLNVTAVSDAPAVEANGATFNEDTTHYFSSEDFEFSDIDGDELTAVIITSLPQYGELRYDGEALTIDDLADGGFQVDIADLDMLSFVPHADRNGSDSFGYKLRDSGDESNGGENTSAEATFSLSVTAVNDAPSATGGSVTVTEDQTHTFAESDFGFSDADDHGLLVVIITSLPENGVLKYAGETLVTNDVIHTGFAIPKENLGQLTFLPSANTNEQASFGYRVRDDSADNNADLSSEGEISISITPVNDAPTATSGSASLDEDQSHQFTLEDFGYTDLESDSLAAVIITSLPGQGELRFDGVALTSEDLLNGGVEVAVDDLSKLVYVPAENDNGNVTFAYRIRDAAGTENGGEDTSAEATFTLEIDAVSDAPDSSGGDVQVDEDQTHTFSSDDFNFSDVDGDALKGIYITGLPANGKLKFEGAELVDGDLSGNGYFVAAEDIGLLTFEPNQDYNGSDSFSFKVQDDSESDADLSGTGTMSISVSAVSDAPDASGGGSVSVDEDSTHTFSSSDFSFQDPDGDALVKVFITSLPANGVLKYDGVELDPEDVSGAGFEIAAADISKLAFVPGDDFTGSSGFTYTVQDSGESGTNQSGSGTMAISVEAVSDAPVATGGDVDIDEDTTKTFSLSDFGFSDVDGDAIARVIITSLPGSGSLAYNGTTLTTDDVSAGFEIDADDIGLLTYVPEANYNGGDSFGYKVVDDGDSGASTSEAATMNITVDAVSDAPVAEDNSIDIDEDENYTFGTGDFEFSDVDTDSLYSVIITSLPTNGTLRLDGVALVGEDIGYGGYTVSASDISQGKLVFQPGSNYHGDVSFDFRVVDSGEGDDTSDSSATLTFNVKSINDDPDMDLPDYSSCETPEPICDAFRVNTATPGSQENPRIAALAGGGYVVAWVARTEGDNATDYDVYAKVYDAAGNQIGDEFRVSSSSANDQVDPSVVATADGGFVVMWSGRNDLGNADIYARSFSADGCALGEGEAMVNTTASGRQFDPVTAATHDGMVVAWTSDGQDGVGYGVYMRVLIDGQATAEIRVNTTTTFDQHQPSVAVMTDGSFVVTWTGIDGGSSSKGVFARRFAADGTALDQSEVLVNVPHSGSYESGDQYQSSVASLAEGGYVVTWTGDGESLTDIFAQRYTNAGEPVGERILINAGQTADEQRDPAVLGLPTGGFLVTWTSWGNEESSLDVFAQRFGTDGYPLGERVLVNSSQVTFEQTTPAIAVLKDGTLVVAWQSNSQLDNNDDYEIYAQLFELMTPYYIEGSAPVLIAPTATVSDVELDQLNEGNGNWTGATLVIQRDDEDHHGGHWGWFQHSPDRFVFMGGNGYEVLENGALLKDGMLLGRFRQINGKLTVDFGTYGSLNAADYPGTATPTTADVNYVLQQIGYWNSSDDPGESVTLNYRIEDGNGNWHGAQGGGGEGRDYGSVTIKLIDVNDAPVARNNGERILEDNEHVFSVGDFRFRDADDNDLCRITIHSLPGSGKLFYDGEEVTQGDLDCEALEVSAADLECGKLVFVPDANFHGTLSFTYSLKDDGGTERGGEDTSETATFEIRVVSVNDDPELDLRGYDIVVTTLDDVVDANDGKLSLREALAMAGDGDSITFAYSLLGGTVHLGSTLEISRNVYINGNTGDSGDRVTLRTDGSFTAIEVTACQDERGVILSGLEIVGDEYNIRVISGPLGSAAAIVNAGKLTLHDMEIKDYLQRSEDSSHADVVSVIYNKSGATLYADDLEIDDNAAYGYGDAINAVTGGSAYLIYNEGQMDLADTDIKDSMVEGGDANTSNGTGGNAYLIYNGEGASFAGDIYFDDDNSTDAGSAAVYGNQGDYYSIQDECESFHFPDSEFCYEAPGLLAVYTEDQEAVRIAPNARVADVELDARNEGAGNWSGASLIIGPSGEDSGHGGGWGWGWFGWWGNHGGEDTPPSEDVLGLENGENLGFVDGQIIKTIDHVESVIGSWSVNDSGKLVIAFQTAQSEGSAIPTTADVNNVLRLVTYRNTSQDPDSEVTLTITVKDGNSHWFGSQGIGGEGRVIGEIVVGINPVNDAPEIGEDGPIVTQDEDQVHVFQTSDFPFTDVEGDCLGGILITYLPSSGTLYVDGRAVTAEQIACGGLFVSVEDIECGRFTYQPDSHFVGVETFTYRVRDDGGTEHGGDDTSNSALFTFNVRSVNDAPELLLSPTANYTHVVDTLLDVCDPNDGVLSLREALAMACDGDSITFAASILDCGDGTIVLNDTLTIDKQVYINGAIDGGRITLQRDEGMDGPIIEISDCVDADRGGAVLQGLVLDGNGLQTYDAALHNYGTLWLHQVTIEGQETTAGYGDDAVSAIFNAGCATLVATDLEVKGNSATGGSEGGDAYAILNLGKFTVDGLDITCNTQTGAAGGMDGNGGDAHALWNGGEYYASAVSFSGNSNVAGAAGEPGCGCDGSTSAGSSSDEGGSEPRATGFELVFVPPALTGQGPDVIAEYTLNGDPVLIAPSAMLSDVELGALREGNGNWSGARVEVKRVSGADSSDVFGYAGESQTLAWDAGTGRITKLVDDVQRVIANFTNTGGVLSIHFAGHGTAYATTEDVNFILQQLTYSSSSSEAQTVELKFTVRDGNPTYDGPQGSGGEGVVIGTVRMDVVEQAVGVPSVQLVEESGCVDGITSTLSFRVDLPVEGTQVGQVARVYKVGEPATLLAQSEALTLLDIEAGYVTISPQNPGEDFSFSAVVARMAASASSELESADSARIFVTFDTTPPAMPELDMSNGITLSGDDAGSYVISGTAEAFSKVTAEVVFDVTSRSYVTNADANGRFTVQVDAAHSGEQTEGWYSLLVTATDRAGNVSETTSRSYHVDEGDSTPETFTPSGEDDWNWVGAPDGNGPRTAIFGQGINIQGRDYFIVHPDTFGRLSLSGSSSNYVITLLSGDLRDAAVAESELDRPNGEESLFEDRPLYQITYFQGYGVMSPGEPYVNLIVQADRIDFAAGGSVRLTADGVIAEGTVGEDGMVLGGHAGNDRIVGGDGDDQLFGHDGDNILIGGLGNDTLVSYGAPPVEPEDAPDGWAPAGDVLIGGDGDDRLVVFGDASTTNAAHLYGGCGEDTFVIAPLTQDQAGRVTADAGFNRDVTIHDFVVGDDKIDLSWLFKSVEGTPTAITVDDLNLAALVGQLQEDGSMSIDLGNFVSGDGAAVAGTLTVNLAGGSTALSAGDFILGNSTIDDLLLQQAQLYAEPV